MIASALALAKGMPWRFIGLLVAVSALIGLGGWGGYTMARDHYEPKLATANGQIGSLTMANTALKSSVDHQNAAVTELQAEATKREQAATAAVQQAHKVAVKSQTRAQAVLLLKPPTGVNQCAAAHAAFDDELKDERGVR